MAIIKCEECGKKISSKAVACPHCGCPVNVQKSQEEIRDESTEVVEKITDVKVVIGCSKCWRLRNHIFKIYIDGKGFGKVQPGDIISKKLAVGQHKIKFVDKSDDEEVICKGKFYIGDEGLYLTFDADIGVFYEEDSDEDMETSDETEDDGNAVVATAYSVIAIVFSVFLIGLVVYYSAYYINRLHTLKDAYKNGTNMVAVFGTALDEVISSLNKQILPWFILSGVGAVVSLAASIARSYYTSLAAVLLEAASFGYIMYRDMHNFVFYAVVIAALVQLIARDVADHHSCES